MQAQIATDRETAADAVTSQLNIEATGSFSAGPQSQDLTIRITLAQVGSHVTTVQTVGTGASAKNHPGPSPPPPTRGESRVLARRIVSSGPPNHQFWRAES